MLLGPQKKTKVRTEADNKLCAYHEAGHAVSAYYLENCEPVYEISIVPRGMAGGYTLYRQQEDRTHMLKSAMIDRIVTSMGGRVAEQITFGDISTGASNDIARATDIIKSMIVDFGMSDKFQNMTLGKGVLGNRGGEPNLVREFSEETQKYIDEEIARIVKERYDYVVNLLSEHKDLLDYIANRLLEIETMEGKEFYEIVNGAKYCAEIASSSSEVVEEQVVADEASDDVHPNIEE